MASAMGDLDRATREELMRVSAGLSARLGDRAGRQAASALAILRAKGLAELREALQPDVAVRLGAATSYSEQFREVCGPEVWRFVEQDPGAVAFLRAWVARLSRMQPGEPGGGSRRRRQSASQPQPADRGRGRGR